MTFTERLNAILPRITDDHFIKRSGLGNEIPFYVFDYPPEQELQIREHISFLLEHLKKNHSSLKVLNIKLFDLMLEHLKERGTLDKAFALEAQKGSKALWVALSASVKPDRFIKLLDDEKHLSSYDIVFISGVGTIWPWVRAHALLNNLQSVTGNASVLLFYPGVYSGQSLKLFDRLETDNYYRAFRLVP